MGIVYRNIAVRGIDVSAYNGIVDWQTVKDSLTHFAAIRRGYGRTTDSRFEYNWQNSKGKVNRLPYWYMDFYSNHNKGTVVYGMSDEEWGAEQAETCWRGLKSDPEGIVFLDIENGNGSYAPALSTVTTRAQTIAKAFLQRMDQLNGKTNGIYCSLGLLTWFSEWFKDRPLWVAWYNEAQTSSTVLAAVRKAGWTGKCYIWQYASDGDANDDNIADGIAMGMQYGFLDYNEFVGTAEDYKYLFGVEMPVIEEPVVEDPEIPIDEEPDTGEYDKYIVNVGKLNLRSKPYVTDETWIGQIYLTTPLNVSKYVEIDNRTWMRLAGQDLWCCLKEGNKDPYATAILN